MKFVIGPTVLMWMRCSFVLLERGMHENLYVLSLLIIHTFFYGTLSERQFTSVQSVYQSSDSIFKRFCPERKPDLSSLQYFDVGRYYLTVLYWVRYPLTLIIGSHASAGFRDVDVDKTVDTRTSGRM